MVSYRKFRDFQERSDTRDDGTEITVSIGSTASDGNVYVMTSESDHIYTCDSYLATAFTCQLSDFEVIAEEGEPDTTDSADQTVDDRRTGRGFVVICVHRLSDSVCHPRMRGPQVAYIVR